MKRRMRVALVAIVGLALAAIFFLPVVPVQVEPFCVQCPGGLFIAEQGYSSPALYFVGCGGIYMTGLPNYAPHTWATASSTEADCTTDCGFTFGELWKIHPGGVYG